MYNALDDPKLLGGGYNLTFSKVFADAETFVKEYTESKLSKINTVKDPELVYYLLAARYANSTIASWDITQFKYKVFSIMFEYGPAWEKRLEIQTAIRDIGIEEAIIGSKRIYNKSYNPSTPPGTGDTEFLDSIDEQTTDGWKKSKLDAYSNILMLIDTDVTEEFIGKFKKLFITVVEPNVPWYMVE